MNKKIKVMLFLATTIITVGALFATFGKPHCGYGPHSMNCENHDKPCYFMDKHDEESKQKTPDSPSPKL